MEHQLDAGQLLNDVTTAACADLFARNGLAVRPADEKEDPISPEFFLCSVIGFSGRDLRGNLRAVVSG